MKRLVIVEVIVFLLISVSVCAHKGTETPGQLPLYEDSLTGWKIWKGFSGYTRIGNYEKIVQYTSILAAAPPNAYVNQNEKYLYENSPGLWFVFSLLIPDNAVTYWSAASELRLTYVAGKDTITVESHKLFFCNDTRRKLFFTYELKGEFFVPNVQKLYKGDNPILVYAMFGDMKKIPEYLVSCTPLYVRSAIKGVSKL